MARRKKQQSMVKLPWEQRPGLRRLFARSRVALAAAALVLLAVGVFSSRVADARQKRRDTLDTIVTVQRAVARFRAEVGRCPRSMVELLHPPRARSTYLREQPKDAWGNPIRVQCPGRNDPDGADVISSGPSGDFLTDDNVQ